MDGDVFGAGVLDVMEKIAKTRLLRHLQSLSPAARKRALSAMPKGMRSQMSYKLLGGEAAAVAGRMPGDAGHGAQHVFNVTRNTQKLLSEMPTEVRRRGTLGALLHDVGREAEGRAKKRMGKKMFKHEPGAWHSELGGQYTDKFLRQHRGLAKNVPGLDRGRLKGVVRAHDTDIHARKPWTRGRLTSDPAASGVYVGDKMEGMGRMGAERTVAMAKKFKEKPAETMKVVRENLQKYHNVAKMMPGQQHIIQPKIRQYKNLMTQYGRTGQLAKAAMSVRDYQRLFQSASQGGMSESMLVRLLRRLGKRASNPMGQSFAAVHRMPPHERKKLMDLLLKVLK